jgi:hypothetical protein
MTVIDAMGLFYIVLILIALKLAGLIRPALAIFWVVAGLYGVACFAHVVAHPPVFYRPACPSLQALGQ